MRFYSIVTRVAVPLTAFAVFAKAPSCTQPASAAAVSKRSMRRVAGQLISDSRRAIATACTRVVAPSFSIAFCTCVRTV